jgi:hypothetical protein
LTQVYQARINQLSASTNSSLAVIDNTTQSSAITSKPKFKLTKGKQYEVCRVFNDYLNSSYYKSGDCTIKEYPNDKRLRSPEYKQVDILQYEDDFIAKIAHSHPTDEENARSINYMKELHRSGELTAWTTILDVKNDGKKEAVISTRRYWSLEEAKTQSCDGLGGGINRLVNGKIDDSAWDGHLGEPILFDGRTFLLYGGEAEYSIYEPMSIEHYRSGQETHGNVAIVGVCDFKIN